MSREMKTKEQVIIKAWIELDIKTPFGICDKTGWYRGYFSNGIDDITNEFGDIVDLIDYDIDMSGIGKFRPKSLQGIETNNNWIKIESEKDLPEQGSYEYKVGTMINSKFYLSGGVYDIKEVNQSWDEDKITHYQKITKPEPPIF